MNYKTKEISNLIIETNEELDIELIPMREHSKRPAVSWKVKDNRSKSLKNEIPTYAIVTGDIAVIDCDRHKESEDGVLEFESLLAELELGDLLDYTLVIGTPNQGKHYYFKTDTPLSSSNGGTPLGKGIDLKASGGLIIGPGSQLEDMNGKIKEYEIISNTTKIGELPDSIMKILESKTEEKKNVSKSSKTGNKPKENKTEEEKLSKLLTLVFSSTEGNRNSTLYKASAQAGTLGINKDLASRLVMTAQAIGLSQKESEETFESGYSKGIEEFNSKKVSKDIPEIYKGANKSDFYSDSNLKNMLLEEARSKFLINNGSLYCYDKGLWREETTEAKFISFIEDRLTEIRDKVREIYPEDEIKGVNRNLTLLGESSKTKSVAYYLRQRITRSGKEIFDKDKHLVLAENCVIDLRTGEALEFSHDYYMSCRLGAEYRPELGTSRSEKYFDFIDPEHKDLVLAVLGQALTGDYGQSMLILTGKGSNGKSLFFQVLSEVFGDYYCSLDSNVFYSKKSDRDSIVTLANKRLALSEELCSDSSEEIDVQTLKKLIATPKITGRGIYEKTVTFKNNVSIIASSNELPRFKSDTTNHAEERRVLLSSCPYTYLSKPTEENHRPKDYSLERDLYKDKGIRSEILNAIVSNSVAYLASSDTFIDSKKPESITRLVNEWLAKDELKEPLEKGFIFTGNPLDVVPLRDIYLFLKNETRADIDWDKLGATLATSKFLNSKDGVEVVRDARRIPSKANLTLYRGTDRELRPGDKAYHVKAMSFREEFELES